MPLVIPSALIVEKNLLYSTGAFLELLEITISELGETVRIVNNNEDIVWNGQTWSRFSFEPGDIKESKEGETPRIPIKVSNVSRAMEYYIDQTDEHLIGDSVNYYLVHSEHLDDEAVLTIPLTILYAEADPVWVTFYLGAENFFLQRHPLNTFSRKVCRYKKDFGGSRCKYSGSDTTCTGLFSDCIAKGNTSNFGNCPALPGGGFNLD